MLDEIWAQYISDNEDHDSNYEQPEQQVIQEIEENEPVIPPNLESGLDGNYWSTKNYALSIVQQYYRNLDATLQSTPHYYGF